MSKPIENVVKLFGMTGQLIAEDLTTVEKEFSLELGHIPENIVRESEYYPQFEQSVRKEAASMAAYYEIFYCLEKSIRKLIREQMQEDSEDWWLSKKIPEQVDNEVRKRIRKEIEAGVTRRSTDKLDYTTFGELTVIITANWDVFVTIFNSKKAVERVLSNLNTLRSPIAHCSPISEDEILRLRLTVRDWFRLMGSTEISDEDEI